MWCVFQVEETEAGESLADLPKDMTEEGMTTEGTNQGGAEEQQLDSLEVSPPPSEKEIPPPPPPAETEIKE